MIGARQFVAFVGVGATAALANWLSRIGFGQLISFEWAVVAAYFVGMTTAFSLNRIYVFPTAGRPLAEQISLFVIVNLIMLPVVWVGSVLLLHWVFPAIGWTYHVEEVAHAIALGAPTLFSFVLHRLLTFAPAGKQSTRQ